MAQDYPPRDCHSVPAYLRLSGLEPRLYQPDTNAMRSTFMNIGERCNVAGSSIYKKAIVDGDYDKALGIAAKQVQPAPFLPWRDNAHDLLLIQAKLLRTGKRLQLC